MDEKQKVILCVLLAVFCQYIPISSAEELPANCNRCDGFGYEILISKMEHLEHRYLEQQSEILKLNYQINQNVNRLEKAIEDVIIPKLNQLTENLSQLELKNKDRFEKTQAISTTKQNDQTKIMEELLKDLKLVKSKVHDSPIRSCSDEPTKTSGRYLLQPFDEGEPFHVHCEQSKHGGGWIVFQYRFDGSVDFYCPWADYKAGFGQPGGEFWLGLERLYRLTRDKNYILMIEMETYDGKYHYMKYDEFEIGSESEGYSLKRLGESSGTTEDLFTVHKRKMFSTWDKDNDSLSSRNCAVDWHGGWWYDSCGYSNLNGRYMERNSEKANFWSGYNGLRMTRMMIKEE